MSVTASAAGKSSDREYASQQMPRLRDVAALNQCANLAAGDGSAANLQFRIGNHLEAKIFSKVGQAFDVAFCFVTKVKILAFVHFLRLQSLAQNLARKLLRR